MSVSQDTSIGEQLRKAREAKKWTLEEAARRTKLKRDALALLEADAFEKLPSLSYARGFIRIYARELGVDGWSLLKKLNSSSSVEESLEMLELQPEDLEAIPKRSHTPLATSQGIGLFVILGVLLLALSIGGLQLYRVWPAISSGESSDEGALPAVEVVQPVTQGSEEIPAAVAVPAQAETPEATPVATAVPVEAAEAVPVAEAVEQPANLGSQSLQLAGRVGFSDADRWVRVIGIRNGEQVTLFENILTEGEVMPGRDQSWRADSFVITFREASAAEIIYNGTNYGPYDYPGVQRVSIPRE